MQKLILLRNVNIFIIGRILIFHWTLVYILHFYQAIYGYIDQYPPNTWQYSTNIVIYSPNIGQYSHMWPDKNAKCRQEFSEISRYDQLWKYAHFVGELISAIIQAEQYRQFLNLFFALWFCRRIVIHNNFHVHLCVSHLETRTGRSALHCLHYF